MIDRIIRFLKSLFEEKEEVKPLVEKKHYQHGRKPIIVAQYNLDGSLLHIYKSIAKAEINNGYSKYSLAASFKGSDKAYKSGYIWLKCRDGATPTSVEPYIPYKTGRKKHGEGKKSTDKKIKVLLQIKDGEVVNKWKSAQQACRELNYNAGEISRVTNGKKEHYKGFIWKYEEQND